MKRAWLHLPYTLPLGIYIRSPQNIVFARLNSPSSLSLSSYERRSGPLLILVTLCWTLQHVHVSLLLGSAAINTLLQMLCRGEVSPSLTSFFLLLIQPDGQPPESTGAYFSLSPGAGRIFALLIVEIREVLASPFHHPVMVPLDGSTSLQCISYSFHYFFPSPTALSSWCLITLLASA